MTKQSQGAPELTSLIFLYPKRPNPLSLTKEINPHSDKQLVWLSMQNPLTDITLQEGISITQKFEFPS